jgi:hypothetical protein
MLTPRKGAGRPPTGRDGQPRSFPIRIHLTQTEAAQLKAAAAARGTRPATLLAQVAGRYLRRQEVKK